jgi:GNAT superfamily N-acetyltransferase
MAAAGAFLESREAEHNLIFGICSQIEADPTQYEIPPRFLAVLDGKRVVGAAIQTPPWRLVLSVFDVPGVGEALATELRRDPLPGAVGPAESGAAFAAAWHRDKGGPAPVHRHERAFQLRAVTRPRPAPGAMARAGQADRDVVINWIEAFNHEAGIGGPVQAFDRMADRWLAGIGRTLYLWHDEGRPVSMAGAGGRTPHGIRVGPVYTPPEVRGRGYASNLVAGVSQLQLDAGLEFVFLFTDLANPTANKIYQSIGYEPVIEIDEYDFA